VPCCYPWSPSPRPSPSVNSPSAFAPRQRLVVLLDVLAEAFRHLARAAQQEPLLGVACQLATQPVLELLHAIDDRRLQQRQLLRLAVHALVIQPAQVHDHLIEVRYVEALPRQLLPQLPRLVQTLPRLAPELADLFRRESAWRTVVGRPARSGRHAARDTTLLLLATGSALLLAALALTLTLALALLTLALLALALLTLALLALTLLTLALLTLALLTLALLALTLLALTLLALALLALTLLAFTLLALLTLTLALLLALLALALFTQPALIAFLGGTGAFLQRFQAASQVSRFLE
jgi:hypothetical protein